MSGLVLYASKYGSTRACAESIASALGVAALDVAETEQAELGLDSVPAVMLAAYPDIVRTELGVPDSLAIAIGIALGHAEREDPMNKLRSPRRSLAEILTVRGL